MKTTTVQLVARFSSTSSSQPRHIVAADHPSLDRDIETFLQQVPLERGSLTRQESENGGFRLAAIERGRVVGLARMDDSGELYIAVAIEHRGLGIGTLLGSAALERAIALDYRCVSMRPRRRSRAARRVGEAMGCVVVENARGRRDMVAHLPAGLRSA